MEFLISSHIYSLAYPYWLANEWVWKIIIITSYILVLCHTQDVSMGAFNWLVEVTNTRERCNCVRTVNGGQSVITRGTFKKPRLCVASWDSTMMVSPDDEKDNYKTGIVSQPQNINECSCQHHRSSCLQQCLLWTRNWLSFFFKSVLLWIRK